MAESSLFQNGRIEVKVPSSDQIDLSGAIQERKSLFLDELVDVYVLLHTTSDKASIEQDFTRLSISLEVVAPGTQSQSSQSQGAQSLPPSRDVVAVHKIDDVQHPLTTAASQGTTFAWSTKIHIDRTLIASTSSTLSITATLSLAAPPSHPSPTPAPAEDEYLPSGIPVSSPNLLEALAYSRTFADYPNPPYLAVPRLSAPTPSPRSQQTLQVRPKPRQPLRGTSAAFKSYEAVIPRLRVIDLGRGRATGKVLANVVVAVTEHVSRARIESLEIATPRGKVEPCGSGEGAGGLFAFPREMKQGDSLSLTYNILPDGYQRKLKPMSRDETTNNDIVMTLNATIFDIDNPSIARQLRAQCRTPIDPSTLHQEPHPSPSLNRLLTITTSRHSSTPSHPKPGDTIRLDLLITNHSAKRTLNLAVIPIAPWANPAAPDGRSWMRAQSQGEGDAGGKEVGGRLPVWLFASARLHPPALSSANSTTQPNPLSPSDHDDVEDITSPLHPSTDMKAANEPMLLSSPPLLTLQPLPPGTSTTAELSLLVLEGTGKVSQLGGGLEAIRVVDLDSWRERGQWMWVDITGEVLASVVVDGAQEGGEDSEGRSTGKCQARGEVAL